MLYDVSYEYEDGSKDYLVRRKYKNDMQAYGLELQRALKQNSSLDKKTISKITIFKGYMSKGERRWKTICEQTFNGAEVYSPNFSIVKQL